MPHPQRGVLPLYYSPYNSLYFITSLLRILLYMRLISLNTWAGKFFEPLAQFIKQHSGSTDIFCFQEMQDTKSDAKEYRGIRANLLWEIKRLLPDFQMFYFPVMGGFDDEAEVVDINLTFGQAIFIKNTLKVTSSENYFITKDADFQVLKKDFSNLPTPLQYLSFISDKNNFALFNFHGVPAPGDKLDSEKRLKEARKSREIIDSKKGAKIITGDFNLLPETESIKIFSKDMRNLIKDFKIQRTRSKLSPFYGREDFQKFADYVFVSKEVNVKSFQVLREDISDHLPMVLEFN